jgi:hypothetical protein
MTQIHLFADAGVDFLELSGGTYEDPTVQNFPALTSRLVYQDTDNI